MGAAVAAVPVVFDFLGYHFQAGPLIVGIAGVVLSRQIITLQQRGKRRWGLELAVMLFCAFVTALIVQDQRSLLFAGVTGIGVGGIGVGIIGLATGFVSSRLKAAGAVLFGVSPAAFDAPSDAAKPEPQDDDAVAIDAAMETLNKED